MIPNRLLAQGSATDEAPSLGLAMLYPPRASTSTPIDSSNIGFQLLKKNGWRAGTGLGASEQGILEPIQTVTKKNKRGLGAEKLNKVAKQTIVGDWDILKGRLEPLQTVVKENKRGLGAEKPNKVARQTIIGDWDILNLKTVDKKNKRGLGAKKPNKVAKQTKISDGDNSKGLRLKRRRKKAVKRMPLYNYSLLPLDALCVHHRLNPGVCWYWLNNNCLNPKCAYWHPPLDGLLGAQIPISTGPSAPVAAHVSNASTKKGMPCMYFQKGCCLKGDWCPFLHAPNSSSTKALPMPETTFSDELATIKKRLAELEKSVQQQKVTSINAAKSFKDTTGAKLPVLLESAPPRNEFVLKRRAPLQSGITEFSGQRSAPQQSGITEFLGHGNAPHLSNGNQVSWSCRAQQPQLSEDSESLTRNNAEEVSREPSPGFDVLVDDEGKGSDFYAGEDRYRMSRKRDAEYDTDHPINDFNIINGVGDEGYHDRFFFPSLEHRMGQYALEQHRASFGGSYQESRPYSNLHNLGQVDESDLRYTLAKHKKPNGLRSVISHENASYMLGDWNYQGLRWDGQHITSGENYFGSYFQLPQRSLSLNNRDMVRGTDRRDMVRTNIPSDRGRSYNSIQVEVEDDYNNGGKKCRGQQSLGKRKHLMLDGQLQQGGNDVPFEGPKPLEEILKRKRRETVGTVVDRNSSNNDVTVVEKNQEGATNNMTSTPVGNNEEAHKNTTTIHDTEMDKSKIKDGMLREDGVDQESEPSEQRDGESYYDHIRVERTMNCKMENEHAKGEYIDEEEEDNDDEFTKKMGL